MKTGDVYRHLQSGKQYIMGLNIWRYLHFLRVSGLGVYRSDEFNKYFVKENKMNKHNLAVEKVKEHLDGKGWTYVETQHKDQPVNVLKVKGKSYRPILPPLLAFKGDKERWVWVMYKGSTSQGGHGIEEIKTKAPFTVQNQTRIPVWVYIYQADTNNVLRISLDNYKVKSNRVWVGKMNRAMWFLNRKEFKGA